MDPDTLFMTRAMTLARGGVGWTRPNPLVGAVLVRDGEVVGEGYHQQYGGGHAEAHALLAAGDRAAGAVLYVNLEPCAHTGNTPPCCEAVAEAGVERVVCAVEDPDPRVAGKGIAYLRSCGIEVTVGVCEREARELNEVFFTWITTRRPFIIMKSAMSLDGKTATSIGESRWISGAEANRHTHRLRHRSAAIMVGIETVLADNPRLTTRLGDDEGPGRNPLRIVMDSRGRIPEDSFLVESARQIPLAVVAGPSLAAERAARLEAAGAEVIRLASEDRVAMIRELVPLLGRRGLDSLLVEGGGTLAESFIKAEAVDKYITFIAPLLIGGRESRTPVGGSGWQQLSCAMRLSRMSARMLGSDILVEAYPERTFEAGIFPERTEGKGA